MTSSFLSKRDENYKYAKMLLNSVDNSTETIKSVAFNSKILIGSQQKGDPISLICGIQLFIWLVFFISHKAKQKGVPINN